MATASRTHDDGTSAVVRPPSGAGVPSTMTPACNAAMQFMAGLNSRDFSKLQTLFADKTYAIGPDGKVRTDSTEIAEFFDQAYKAMKTPWRGQIVNLAPAGPNGCFMQFNVSNQASGSFEAGAIDYFEVDAAGRISYFMPYTARTRVAQNSQPATKPETVTLACRAGERYIAALNARDFAAVKELYAEHVNYIGPDGVVRNSPEEVAAFEERGFKAMTGPWQAKIVSLSSVGAAGCLLEFQVSDTGDGVFVPGAIERFEVDETGKVTHQMPYISSVRLARSMANTRKAAPPAAD